MMFPLEYETEENGEGKPKVPLSVSQITSS
jgi:hypothetical protein